MFYYYFDPTYMLVVIGVVICMIASARVNSVFSTYSRMRSHSGMTGKEAAERINRAKESGHRVICVGTTSCRTIESAADENGHLRAGSGWTDIFIYPGYKFKLLDCLITNFHLPESTLIMLVSAFAGYEHTMAAYDLAVREKYRFFSFGDAMLIVNDANKQ